MSRASTRRALPIRRWGGWACCTAPRPSCLQNADGQIAETHSISAGLDYAAVGPEHSYLRDTGRAQYTYATDDEALNAFSLLCKLEGIIPALESSHAVAEVIKRAPHDEQGSDFAGESIGAGR